jgi:hypothetical protein
MPNIVVLSIAVYGKNLFPLVDCAKLKIVHEKTICQFQIKFITKYYLQMYKTLLLFTSVFTF